MQSHAHRTWRLITYSKILLVRTTMANQLSSEEQKKSERNALVFLTIFLAPILTVMIVGGYGLMVWISWIIFGPPTL